MAANLLATDVPQRNGFVIGKTGYMKSISGEKRTMDSSKK